MKTLRTLFMAALIVSGCVTQAVADCQIAEGLKRRFSKILGFEARPTVSPCATSEV